MLALYLTTAFWTFLHTSAAVDLSGVDPSPILDINLNLQPDATLQPRPYTTNLFPPQFLSNTGIFAKEPSASIFIKTVIEITYSTPIIRETFDLSQTTAQQYSQFIYEFNTNLFKSLGFENATLIAEFASRPIGLYFDVLTLPMATRTIASTAADFLLVEGILNTDNAENLAMIFTDFVKNQAQASLTADPTSKFFIIAYSFFDFVFKVDANAPKTAVIASYCYGFEWFISAINYNGINRPIIYQ